MTIVILSLPIIDAHGNQATPAAFAPTIFRTVLKCYIYLLQQQLSIQVKQITHDVFR